MKLCKLPLLFISFSFNNFQLNAVDVSLRNLNIQFKDFRHRIHIYLKCLSGPNKCTLQERSVIEKNILKDGAILTATIVIGTTGLLMGKKYLWPRWEEYYNQYQRQLLNQASTDITQARANVAAAQNYYKQEVQLHGPDSPQAHEAKQRLIHLETLLNDTKIRFSKIALQQEHYLRSGQKLAEEAQDPLEKAELAAIHGTIEQGLEKVKKIVESQKNKK